MVFDFIGFLAQEFYDSSWIPGVPTINILVALWVCCDFNRSLMGKKLPIIQALFSTFLVGFGGSTLAGMCKQ